tara:strand:- start:857 stop:1255 length:399 start_codon:yes stop_codon:yes gene_type:complete
MRTRKRPVAAWLLVVVACGCLESAPGPPEPPVDPPPVIETPRTAAEQFADAYRAELAVVAADIAERAAAGEFADLTAVNDAWVNGSGTARKTAQGALIRAMNENLRDARGKPGTAAAPLFRELAAGFERGAE